MYYVVISGNPVDGLLVHGPFEDPNLAGDWARDTLKNETWWTTKLSTPDLINYLGG